MSTAPAVASPPSKPWDFDAFVSYAHNDKVQAQALVLDLRSRDVKLWFDCDEIPLGEMFVNRIERGLQQSRDMIQLASTAALDSPWVQEEKAYALRQLNERSEYGTRRLIPVLMDHSKLEGFLASRLWIDLSDPARRGAELDRLALALRGRRALDAIPSVTVPVDGPNYMASKLLYLNRHIERKRAGLVGLRRIRRCSPLVGLMASAPLVIWLDLQVTLQAASTLAAAAFTFFVSLSFTWPRQAAVERDIACAQDLRDSLELCRSLPERLECHAADGLFWKLFRSKTPTGGSSA